MTKLLKDFRSDLEKLYSPNNSIEFNKISKGSRVKVLWICSQNHIFEDEVKKVVSRKHFKCIDCNTKVSMFNQHPELGPIFAEELNKFSFKKLLKNNTPVWWVLECKHITKRTVNSILKTKQCYKCEPDKLRKSKVFEKYPNLKEYWNYNLNKADPERLSSWDKEKYWWNCDNNHAEYKTIYQKIKSNSKCKLCPDKSISDMTKIGQLFDKSKNSLPSNSIYKHSRHKAWWICESGHSYQREIKDQVLHSRLCPECFKNESVSSLELKVRKFFSENFETKTLFNHREIKGVYELDLYLPDFKLAFEVNGEYWHSDYIAVKNGWKSAEEKHLRKILKCKENSIDLYYIWEDDWVSNKEEVIKEITQIIEGDFEFIKLLKRLTSNRDTET